MEDMAFPDGGMAHNEGPCAHGPKEGKRHKKHALGPMPMPDPMPDAGAPGLGGDAGGPPGLGGAPGGAAPAGAAAV